MAKLKNLPDKFFISHLSKFDFGSPDGKDDKLLEGCALATSPIIEFLTENKSILVGERGVGKTALFRLLSDGKMKFQSTEKYSQIYAPIDEELGYKTLRQRVLSQVKDWTTSLDVPHRIVWEVYLYSRSIEALSKKFGDNSHFKDIKDKFYKAVGWPQNQPITLLDIFIKNKKTIGVKLENGHLGYVVPNFYTSIEPAKQEDPTEIQWLDLSSMKTELNAFLKENKAVAYLLIDKLDEFVSGDDYKTQKQILQALLHCWRDYQSHTQLKVKLFVRKDLYDRLDFSSIGRDKIDSKKVELRWSAEDIRHFIASRIFYNLSTCLKKSNFKLELNDGYLTIDKTFLIEKNFSKPGKSFEMIKNKNPSFMLSLKKKALQVFAILTRKSRDEYDARTISSHDEACSAIITALFPRKVLHMNKSHKQEPIDLSQYFGTHFQFASGCTTPRVILLYLQKCLDNARAYYRSNPDQQISLNDKGEYPVFLRDQLFGAYEDVRKLCFLTIVGLNKKFERPAISLIQNLSNTKNYRQVSFKDAKKHLTKLLAKDEDVDESLKNFFAFYEHAGLFKCMNRAQDVQSRTYEFPIFFQKIYIKD